MPKRSMIIGSIPKLHAKHLAWIMPLCLSFLMSGTLSCINMLMSVGFIENFFSKWLATWMVSWLIAFPVVLIFLPMVRRLAGFIVKMPSPPAK